MGPPLLPHLVPDPMSSTHQGHRIIQFSLLLSVYRILQKDPEKPGYHLQVGAWAESSKDHSIAQAGSFLWGVGSDRTRVSHGQIPTVTPSVL